MRTNYAKEEILTGDDRAWASWLVARMPALDEATRKRLLKHVTHMVIKTPLGPSHDDTHVRISASMALVEHARKNPEDRKLRADAKESIRFLVSEEPINNAPVGPLINHMGHQIDAWYRDQATNRYFAGIMRYRMLVEPLRRTRN
jgi:hypothetical protein